MSADPWNIWKEDKVISNDIENFSIAADERPDRRKGGGGSHNRGKGKHVTEPTGSKGRSSALVWVFCLVLLGIVGFEYWQIREVRAELDQTRAELSSARTLLSSVTGEISATGESLSEKDSAIRSELTTINHEIRKLWDLANKRNKKDISIHDGRLDKLESQAGKVNKEVDKVTAETKFVRSKTADLEVSLQKQASQQVADKSEMIAVLDALKTRMSQVETQTADQAKWQAGVEKSVDSFRVQVNRKLLQVESSLRELKQPAEKGL